MVQNHDLDILVISLDAECRILACWQRANQGDVEVDSKLDLQFEQLQILYKPKDYGRYLGEALFQSRIKSLFERAICAGRLNVSLNLMDSPYSRLHWEWLQAPLAGGWDFLGLSQQVGFSMYPASDNPRQFPKLGSTSPRALLVVAAPRADNYMNLEIFNEIEVVNQVREALADQTTVDVLASDQVADTLGFSTLENLFTTLSEKEYPILHIVAHGKVLDDGCHALYLNNAQGGIDAMEANELVKILHKCHTPPRLIFLSSCHSANPEGRAGEKGNNLSWCLAAEVGVHCVIAMTETITLQTACDLAKPFYRKLFEHGLVEQAISEASAGLIRRDDIVIPTVYSRLRGRALFQRGEQGTVTTVLEKDEIPALIINQQRKRIGNLEVIISVLLPVLVFCSFMLWNKNQKNLRLQTQKHYDEARRNNDESNWIPGRDNALLALELARSLKDQPLKIQANAQLRRALYHIPNCEIWFSHPEPLLFHIWFPDKTRLLTVSPRLIRIWQVGHPEAIGTMENLQGKLCAIALSQDGDKLLTASEEGSLWLRDLRSGKIVETVENFSHQLVHLVFDPTPDWAHAADERGHLFSWHPKTGEIRSREAQVCGLATENGTAVAIVRHANQLDLIRILDGEVLSSFNNNMEPPSTLNALDRWRLNANLNTTGGYHWFHQNFMSEGLFIGKRACGFLVKSELRVLTKGAAPWSLEQSIQNAAFSDSGEHIATLDTKGFVDIWGYLGGKPLATIGDKKIKELLGFHGSTLTFREGNGAISRWSSRLITNSHPLLQHDKDQRLLDMKGRLMFITHTKGVDLFDGEKKIASAHKERVLLGAFSKTGRLAVTIDRLGIINFWADAKPQVLKNRMIDPLNTGFLDEDPWIATTTEITFPISGTRISLDLKLGEPFVVSLSPFAGYYLVNDRVYDREGHLLVKMEIQPQHVALSDDSNRVAASDHQSIAIWNLLSRSPQTGVVFDSEVTCLGFTTEGKHLAIGTEAGRAFVYDVNGEILVTEIDTMGGPITYLLFEGNNLITLDNNNLRRWQWRE